jgi:hypothetical protein
MPAIPLAIGAYLSSKIELQWNDPSDETTQAPPAAFLRLWGRLYHSGCRAASPGLLDP